MGEEGDEAAAAHLLQQTADLRLEQDNEGQHAQINHAAEQIVDTVEPEHRGQHQRCQKYEQALEQAGRLGALHPGQYFIKHQRHNSDVQIICDLNRQQIPADISKQHGEIHIHFTSSSLSGHEYLDYIKNASRLQGESRENSRTVQKNQ